MRPGGIGMSLMTDSAVTVLPQPDSPTTPSVSPRVDREVDAVDRAHHAVVGREMRLEPADLEQRLGHALSAPPWCTASSLCPSRSMTKAA